MKKILTTLILLTTFIGIQAKPIRLNPWTEITLADGTIVKAKQMGDAQCHYMQSADGKRYFQMNNVWTSVSDQDFRTQKAKSLAKRAKTQGSDNTTEDDGLGKFNQSGSGSVKSIGAPKIPLLMVEFADRKFQDATTPEAIQMMYNEENFTYDEYHIVGSARDYFISQSSGMFSPDFSVVGKVSLSKGYAYYGHDEDGSDANMEEFVQEAINQAINQGVDFKPFINDEGNIEAICMVFAGTPQTATFDPDEIWPHWSNDYNMDYQGYHFNSYFVGSELFLETYPSGIGVFCHEFSHALGLPDLYVTDYNYGKDDAYGFWSILDYGPYLEYGYAPIGYTAYEKSVLGWLDIKNIQEGTNTLCDETSAVILRNPENAKEYWIFENRALGTWYPYEFYYAKETETAYVPSIFTLGTGMMVSHITYDKKKWMDNTINNEQEYKHAYMITADGSKLNTDYRGTHLFGNGVNTISSLPLFDGGQFSVNITDITKGDGTVTFNFNTTTAIRSLEEPAATSTCIYNLNGMMLGTNLDVLPKGIYIVNGKKVIKS